MEAAKTATDAKIAQAVASDVAKLAWSFDNTKPATKSKG